MNTLIFLLLHLPLLSTLSEIILLLKIVLTFLGSSNNLERFFSNKIFQHSCILLSTSMPSRNNFCIFSLYS